jgi:hypothetical protein
MPTSLREQQENIQAVSDPFARNALRTAYHVRRYALLYVAGMLGLLALAIFPTVAGSGHNAGQLSAGVSAGQAAGGAAGAVEGQSQAAGDAGQTGVTGGTGGTGSAGSSGVSGSGTSSSGGPISAAPPVGAGVTRSGVTCQPGVRQLPFSQYADPCVGKFTGNNGGATYNGVTGSTITLAIRHTSDSSGANAAATDAEVQAAGGDSYSAVRADTDKIVAYFNKTFEFYGRQIKVVDFNGQGNGTDETLGQGQAGACADADAEANTVHAFAALNYELNFESEPFSECAARYHLYVPEGSAYFPETYYQKMDPYVWGITMNCNLISQEEAEFIGKQMAPSPAKWAGVDGATNLQNQQRKFATYVPNNAGYQDCTQQAISIDENQYHIAKNREDQYNYALDISTFPNDAQRAIVQFAANKDTTVVLACDPISPIFLTQDALQQNYHPEWMLIGVALTDADNWAQLWTQSEVQGHLFGLSQAGDTATGLDPNGEAGQALKAAGVTLDPSTVVDYYELLSMANQIQAAGPNLTPANIAAGTRKLPVGGGQTGAVGTWNFGTTHTAIVDSRQIYWVGNQTSKANNKQGSYVAVYGGQRYQLGQFPSGQPPYYP